jgi:hypothetical protein
MSAFSRRRRIAVVAALVAAYAVVLNVVLASSLLAGQSMAEPLAGHGFCLASAGVDEPPADFGKTKPTAIHCPLCVAQLVEALPPPVAPSVALRLACGVAYDPLRAAPFEAIEIRRDHQPRGPPQLT